MKINLVKALITVYKMASHYKAETATIKSTNPVVISVSDFTTIKQNEQIQQLTRSDITHCIQGHVQELYYNQFSGKIYFILNPLFTDYAYQ